MQFHSLHLGPFYGFSSAPISRALARHARGDSPIERISALQSIFNPGARGTGHCMTAGQACAAAAACGQQQKNHIEAASST